jgi:hypothetical protein
MTRRISPGDGQEQGAEEAQTQAQGQGQGQGQATASDDSDNSWLIVWLVWYAMNFLYSVPGERKRKYFDYGKSVTA